MSTTPKRKYARRITPLMERILRHIKSRGTLTTLQLSIDLECLPYDMWRHLNRLRKAGDIECSGTAATGFQGRPVNVWTIKQPNP